MREACNVLWISEFVMIAKKIIGFFIQAQQTKPTAQVFDEFNYLRVCYINGPYILYYSGN